MDAISSIPLANSEKNVLEISGIIAPTVVVFLLANPLATALGRYPSPSIVLNTFFQLVGFTFGLPLTTRDTVAIETFASLATSEIVILITHTSVQVYLSFSSYPSLEQVTKYIRQILDVGCCSSNNYLTFIP